MIAIKDFKMPENCLKCPMQFGGWCYVSPPEVDERVAPTVDEAWKQGKPDWCPLVEVPDADAGGSCSEFPNNSDSISRRAAIGAADRADYTGLAIEDVKKVTDEVVKELKQLPAAQPEIILCKDCEYSDFAGLNNKRLYCMKHSSYFYEDDFCSYAVRKEDV